MSKVERRIIAVGQYGQVACAVDASLAAPAAVFLDELKTGYWDDPEVGELPDERQVKEYYRFLALCKKIANGEDLEDFLSYNRLQDGVWELKVGIMRLAFYDTNGQGSWTPKPGDRHEEFDGKVKWLIPMDFDYFLRLANSFPKTEAKAPPEEILRAMQIRKEDVNHDRDEQVRG
ncbi:hypothetical protein GU243_08235 [Pseudarthrobacter psychrotolerans]|uniref:Uncharacterized protein n=1 Tax=Pseudarthrobacter psychrotolerans TaxID=2697569 RepID=A0A6P1NHB5_9MICC|nr:hypothetical protein [Pseudarthrobacter psychrotolerans]QHK19716.1 hypothetical protein GU243_08235 [Pseudarthrobacter psychrotolerans]